MPPVLTKGIQMQVKQRNEQIDALQQQILGLERTRDRYVFAVLQFNRQIQLDGGVEQALFIVDARVCLSLMCSSVAAWRRNSSQQPKLWSLGKRLSTGSAACRQSTVR